jgi:hypothetical protein
MGDVSDRGILMATKLAAFCEGGLCEYGAPFQHGKAEPVLFL